MRMIHAAHVAGCTHLAGIDQPRVVLPQGDRGTNRGLTLGVLMTSADRLDELLAMWRRDIDSVPFPEFGITDVPLQRNRDTERTFAQCGQTPPRQNRPETRHAR